MWDFVPVGGYVIFDDFSGKSAQRSMAQLYRCWQDFRRAHGLTEELLAIDWSSSFFRKRTDVKVDWNAHKVDKERLQARAFKSVAASTFGPNMSEGVSTL